MKSFFTVFVFLSLFSLKGYSQDTTSNIKFGVRYTFFYNYKVLHHVPAFSMDIGRHNMYLGIQVSTILKSFGDPVDIYDKYAYGVNFGYRFAFWKKQTKLVPFTQFNFSIYQLKYTHHQMGPPFSTKKQNLIVENTLSFGVNYNPVKHFHIYTGVGFGSYGGFFLLIDSFTPTCYMGVEYKF